MDEIKEVLMSLIKVNENEYVEFKEAKNNFDFDDLGKYFSALSNGANLANKQYAWLIFGVNDKTHEFVNTNYRKGSDLNKLKYEIVKFTNDNLSFLDIYELNIENKRVIMYKIPAAVGVPTTWKKVAYDRVGEHLDILNESKRDIILSTINVDWSRQVISELTINDLDEKAILKAREQFKKKNENKEIANDIDKNG